jgi:hypothetical protein
MVLTQAPQDVKSDAIIVYHVYPMRATSERCYSAGQGPAENTAENIACSGAANLRTLPIQNEVMVLTPRGGVSATAAQQADHPGGKNAI